MTGRKEERAEKEEKEETRKIGGDEEEGSSVKLSSLGALELSNFRILER
jgi:hypothetical protein